MIYTINKFAIVVPTLNAGPEWETWITALKSQESQPDLTLIIDSSSSDNTIQLAKENGFRIKEIQRNEFNHGGTRQLAVDLLEDEDLIVFLTQDAILADSTSLASLLAVFSDSNVGVAFGRQLPKKNADPIESHARYFNYPENNRVVSMNDATWLGVKAAFNSNSFAAYRSSVLQEVGGFPDNVILGEDSIVAARVLLNGGNVAYCADAKVYHSHHYTIRQEFSRYFDIGVLHSREAWLLDKFGKPEGEGIRFVRSELNYLLNKCQRCIPSAIVRTLMKYIGYRLGRSESKLPLWLKKKLSMHKGYWIS